MKAWMKNGARLLIFCLLAAFATLQLADVLHWKDSKGIEGQKAWPEQTVDAAVFGSSHVYCAVNPALMWQEEGIACRSMAESGQLPGSTYYYMKELLKHQRPRVMVVDLYTLTLTYSEAMGNLYRNTLNLPWSADAAANAEYALSMSVVPEEDRPERLRDILLKFPVFHSRYSELTEEDFRPIDLTDGNYVRFWKEDGIDEPEACQTEERVELTEDQLGWLEKYRALADEAGIPLIFTVIPYDLTEEDMAVWNAVSDWCEEAGIPFYNFCRPELAEEIGFDWSGHFNENDYKHLNVSGAECITMALTEILKENCDLPDRRGQNGYDHYDAIQSRWQQDCSLQGLADADYPNELQELLDETELPYVWIAGSFMDEAAAYLADWDWADALKEDGCYLKGASEENGGFRLSEKVVMIRNEHGIGLYENAKPVDLGGCQLYCAVIDPATGRIGCEARFTYSDGDYSLMD